MVDAHDQGWYLTGTGLYHADYGRRRELDALPYDTLDIRRGPLRPVGPITGVDARIITGALAPAGTRAAGSVTVALYQLFRARPGAAIDAGRALLAGREGSWESEGLATIAWEIGSRVAEKPSRFDANAVRVLVATIDRWVTAPDRYTEVAATLAHLFGRVADAAGGWGKVADRYLQPGTRFEQNGTRSLYGYLMSTAATFNSGPL